MQYRRIEMVVGVFVLLGLLSMVYMAVKLGNVGGFGQSGYSITASFDDVGAIRSGADVMVAGVSVGSVSSISLSDDDEAVLTLHINEGVALSKDTIASIRTKGIIGERFVRVLPGGDEEKLAQGDEIFDTESVINLEDLVSKYMFSGDK
ncbi:MAG: outer membrane lipid asymmetry maintenance protein MlaD [Mariprofundaceae bacterium]|nr:outer membrane lipid asymmetry maintenance protein MlaD [Mariprofundaceae bacterium]